MCCLPTRLTEDYLASMLKGGNIMELSDKRELDKINKILSSSHINFLFGAGVNGRALPQMNQLVETKKILEKNLGRKIIHFEQDVSTLSQSKKNAVMKRFTKELKDAIEKIYYKHEDRNDIKEMFSSINSLVVQTENRNNTMKQINIYTTNYDPIIETVLDDLGLLYNVVSSNNYSNHDKFFEMIGYDYKKRRYLPTYLISKIHGDIDDPILPNITKHDEVLLSKRFEILFIMRAQLSRFNSVLFIIGYSGNDHHINELINGAITFGITV